METCGYTPQEAGDRRVGELVIAVTCVVGTTYTGDIDDVEGINQVLVEGGWDIPIQLSGFTSWLRFRAPWNSSLLRPRRASFPKLHPMSNSWPPTR
jgi:hypothetical protein